MLIKRHNRRDLRFTTRGLLIVTGISALLVTLWLPRIRAQLETAKNLRIAAKNRQTAVTSSGLFGNVERGESIELAEKLSFGADPNAKSEVLWGDRKVLASVLNIAIRNGDHGSAQMLLDAGADPNLAMPQVPLQTALELDVDTSSKQNLIIFLLESGAELQSHLSVSDRILEQELPDAVAIFKQHGIEYGLREMCIAGDFGSLKEHLTPPLYGKSTEVRAYHGTSRLLGIALLRSHTEIADWLLKSRSSTNVDDLHMANAIHLAAVGNCVEMLPQLVSAGCNINAGDVTGDTPLNYAIAHSEPETIAALIGLGADVLQFNEALGMYPVHQAAERFYQAHHQNSGTANADRIVLELLEAGADANQLDASGRTAIERTREFRDRFKKLITSRDLEE